MSKQKLNDLQTILDEFRIQAAPTYSLKPNETILPTPSRLRPGQVTKTTYNHTSTRPKLVVGVYEDSFDVMPLQSLDLSRSDVPVYNISFKDCFQDDDMHVITLTNKEGKEFSVDHALWIPGKSTQIAKELIKTWNIAMFFQQRYNTQTLTHDSTTSTKPTRIRMVGNTHNYEKAQKEVQKKLPISQDTFTTQKTTKPTRYVHLQ